VGDEEHLDHEEDQLDDAQVDIQQLLESAQQGVQLEQLEEAHQPEDAQRAQQRQVGGIDVVGE
jgi:hypothetical protein